VSKEARNRDIAALLARDVIRGKKAAIGRQGNRIAHTLKQGARTDFASFDAKSKSDLAKELSAALLDRLTHHCEILSSPL
jgi:hypothetical protein